MGYVGKVSVDNGPELQVGSTLYGITDTPATTALKIIRAGSDLGSNFNTLMEGITVHIKFRYGNTVQTGVQLKIGSTEAKPVSNPGGTFAWPADGIISFTYDGTNWVVNDGIVIQAGAADSEYNPNGSGAISGMGVAAALETLDGVFSGVPGASKTLSVLTQQDGIVSGAFVPIEITSDQVSDLPSFGNAAAKDVDNAISNLSSTNLPTTAAVAQYVDSKTEAVEETMHFRGVTTTDISAANASNAYVINLETYYAEAGDVLIYDHKKYFWSGSKWESLGDLYTASTGLNLINNAFSVKYGDEAGTAAQGNDPRLSDARTPTSHTHGNITNDGKIGSAEAAVVTDISGEVTTANLSTTISDPEGTNPIYIENISQNAQGKITATKNRLPSASTSVEGITLLGAANGAATYEHTHSDYAPINNPIFTGVVTLPAISASSSDNSAATKKYVDDKIFTSSIPYGTATTADSGEHFSVTLDSRFDYATGNLIQIAFNNTNKTNASLQVNSLLDMPLYYDGARVTEGIIQANRIYTLVFDTNKWIIVGSFNEAGETYSAGVGLTLYNNAFSVIYGRTEHTAVEGNDARLSDAREPTAHSHGNITNGGTLQSQDVNIENNDKLVITDSNNNGLISRSSVSFDGTTTDQFLSRKGTWEEVEGYTLPLASDLVRGGIKLGFTPDNEAQVYPVSLESNTERAYVYVPWTDNNDAVLQTTVIPVQTHEYDILLKNSHDNREEIGPVRYLANNAITVNSLTGRLTVPGGIDGKASSATIADSASAVNWSNVNNTPTTLLGYGITDASIINGVITIGNGTIEPVVSVNGHTGGTVVVTAGDLGLSSALRYRGTTTTAMSDGLAMANVTINSATFTPSIGDVVLYQDQEYLWTGSVWELIGPESSFKLVQTAISDATASTSATTTFVQAVTQDAQGVITVTKAPLNTTGTWSGNAVKDGNGDIITATYVRKITSTDNAIAIYNGMNGQIKDSNILITNNNITTPGNIYLTGGTEQIPLTAGIQLTSTKLNLNLGWDSSAGATLDLFSILKTDMPGAFVLTALKDHNGSTVSTSLVGTPGNEANGGILTWADRRVVTATNNTALGSSTQPVYVNNSGQIVECTSYANATVASAASCTGNASTASEWRYDRGIYVSLATEHDSNSPAALNGSTENASALAIGVNGVLAVEHGGTNRSEWTKFALPYLSNTTAFGQVDPNTSTTKMFLSMTGTGGNNATGAAPVWGTLAEADIPTISITSKTSGTLPVTRGGTGLETMSYINSVLIGNGTTANGNLQSVQTHNGAFYATDDNDRPQFGILPVAQGGTAATSIEGIRANLNIDKIYYGVCNTAGATAIKDVVCSNFTLAAGAVIFVYFTNTNTASIENISLRVESSDSNLAKPIRYQYNNEVPANLPAANYIQANQTYEFHYDGTQWVMQTNYNTDTTPYGVRVYRYNQNHNHDYPLIASNTQMTSTGGIGNNNNESYTDVYGAVGDDVTKVPTVNLSSGLVTLAELKVNDMSEFNGIKGTLNVDYGASLPLNPEEGQIFFQLTNTAYEIPDGGTAGQVLIKASGTNRDVTWGNAGKLELNNTKTYYVCGTEYSATNYNAMTFNTNIYVQSNVLYGAAWNDYAEYRQCEILKPGTCVIENDNGKLTEADERLIAGASIISDTYGMCIGETKHAKTPIAITGRVLAYTYQPRECYHAGMAVCSAPHGTIDIMTREEIRDYPDAIIGIVSEIPDYNIWGANDISVDGRIWIKVK